MSSLSLTSATANCDGSSVSQVSSQNPIVVIIREVKKRGIGAGENEGPAGGNEKDNVNEQEAASTELERSGSK